VFEKSPVVSLTKQGSGWVLGTAAGKLRARKVIVATNGYTGDLVPKLAQTVLPVQSMQLATEPLPADLTRKIMPGGVVLSETRKLAFYMRQTPAGGFMIGGRGAVGNGEDPSLMAALERGLLRLFPDLAGVKIVHRWSGHVALSMDGLPHLHEPEPNLYCMLAYNGRGIALATIFGRMLAEEIARSIPAIYPRSSIKPIPWHPIRRPVMGLGIRWYWLKDSLGLASK
jgi:glycine/D-amino acid oxidase-like deaminating enzyme